MPPALLKTLKEDTKLWVSFTSGALVYLTVIGFLIAWRISFPALAALLGAVIGWGAGVLLAPYPEEQRKFNGLARGIAGLLAGISLSELRNAIGALPQKNKSTLFGALALECYFVFLICLVTTAILVFVARSYLQQQSTADDEPISRAAKGRR
jgi:hypothetical protein